MITGARDEAGEIGDMPLELQAKLLRFLETGEFERLGENRLRKADVRLVAATNRDLGAMIEQDAFRRDLFYRLKVCRIGLPPLRERKEDIPELAGAFARLACARNNVHYKRLTDEAIAARRWYSRMSRRRNGRKIVPRSDAIIPVLSVITSRALSRRPGTVLDLTGAAGGMRRCAISPAAKLPLGHWPC